MSFTTAREQPILTNLEEKQEKQRLDRELAELQLKIDDKERKHKKLADVSLALTEAETQLAGLHEQVLGATNDKQSHEAHQAKITLELAKIQGDVEKNKTELSSLESQVIAKMAELKSLQKSITEATRGLEVLVDKKIKQEQLLESKQTEVAKITALVQQQKSTLENLAIEQTETEQKIALSRKELVSLSIQLSEEGKKLIDVQNQILALRKEVLTTEEILKSNHAKAEEEAQRIVAEAVSKAKSITDQLQQREGDVSLRESWVKQKEELGKAAIADFEMKTHKKLNISFG